MSRTFLLTGLWVLSLFPHPSIAEIARPLQQVVTYLDYSLLISDQKQQCYITLTQGEQAPQQLSLLLTPPCQWVTQETSKRIRQFSYPSMHIDTVWLVAGTPLDWSVEQKRYQKLPEQTPCHRYLQGIAIYNEEVVVADLPMEASYCQGVAVDEKVFYSAAQSIQENALDHTQIPSNIHPAADKLETTSHTTTANKEQAPTSPSLFESIQNTVKRFFNSNDTGN